MGTDSELTGVIEGREAFARWCEGSGLDRSLRALIWLVWQGAVAAERERIARQMERLGAPEMAICIRSYGEKPDNCDATQ